MQPNDPFARFKTAQKQAWGLFAPLETLTTMTAASLVEFAQIRPESPVLDVACGTGVVAITADRAGARVTALDLSPRLLERARVNASIAKSVISFAEGDVEALPFADASFEAVLSQFGHMFAPRPDVALGEMLRVLKPGGRIAFSTWPPEHLIGQMFELTAGFAPPPEGVPPPSQWGTPSVVIERFGAAVHDVHFRRSVMRVPALSPAHFREFMEPTLAPVAKLIEQAKTEPEKLEEFRRELEVLVSPYFEANFVRQEFLMTRATKLR